jgi:hypothetical protein
MGLQIRSGLRTLFYEYNFAACNNPFKYIVVTMHE